MASANCARDSVLNYYLGIDKVYYEPGFILSIVFGSLACLFFLAHASLVLHRIAPTPSLSSKMFRIIITFSFFRVINPLMFSSYGIVRGLNPFLWGYPIIRLLLPLGAIILRVHAKTRFKLYTTILFATILILAFGMLEFLLVWILLTTMNLSLDALPYVCDAYLTTPIIAVGITACAIAVIITFMRLLLVYFIEKRFEEPPLELYSLMAGENEWCMSSLELSSALLMCPVSAIVMFYNGGIDAITLSKYVIILLDSIVSVIIGSAINIHHDSHMEEFSHEVSSHHDINPYWQNSAVSATSLDDRGVGSHHG